MSNPQDDRSIIDLIWERVSSRLGGSSETVQKIKFGRGAVGKISVIAVTAFVAIGGMAIRLGSDAIYVGIGGVVFVTLASFALILYIVCKTPELAVMEGAELVMYQHVQLAAKGYTPNPSEIPVPRSMEVVHSAPQIEEDSQA